MSSIIVGHRGVAGTHPENTKASIEQAAKLGLKSVSYTHLTLPTINWV